MTPSIHFEIYRVGRPTTGFPPFPLLHPYFGNGSEPKTFELGATP